MNGGFRPSTGGALGPGLYCSRDINKARAYARPSLIQFEIDMGAVKKIDRQGHPLQKTWQNHGYDAAYAPPGAVGMRQENCIKDPSRVRNKMQLI